jgi:hypothetical protein
MADQAGVRRVDYEQVLRAIGRLAEQRRLRNICVLQVEGGMVVQGEALVSTREGYHLVSDTRVLSHEDLDKMVHAL